MLTIDIANQIVGAMNNGDRAKATRIIIGGEGKRQSVIVRKYVSELQEDENALLKQRKASNEESMETFNHLLWVLFAGLLILLTLSYFGFRYNHIRQIKLEGEIKASNHFLNTILENIPNMIFIKDAVLLRFVRFNRAGEILLGINREELIGKNDYDMFPREQADAFVSKDNEVLVIGILQDIPEEAISTPEGERWLHTKKIPINDETGNPKYLLGISEDITDSRQYLNEIKKLNAQLEATVNKLISANKEMEAFTYSVSHDLRAPLRIIDGFGEILLKDYGHSLDDEGKQTLGVIMSNAKHMGQLIDDLLNLSRLGRTPLSIKMVDMHKIVEDVIQAMNVMTPHVAKANIKINPISVCECDSSLTRQVWINLISNAVKYSSKEDCPLIEIGSENKNGLNVYYVKDNGVGFDMRYYNKLFGVFQRLHKLSEFEGTGIGLALVHRIITKHGGKIWAEAVENEGAVFYFTLRV